MKFDISIIIVSYNVRDLILKCLQSIFENSENLHLEVIVVDNNSSDDSVSQIREKFPEVILIDNKNNLGFSGANNQGLSIATGEYIFLLNPDTEIVADALQKMLLFLQSHSNVKMIAPRLLNSDKTIQQSVWKNTQIYDLIFELLFLDRIFNYRIAPVSTYSEPTRIKTASGAALFFHKNLVTLIGNLDNNLFWMEDVDFCFRTAKYGDIIYLPETEIIHHSGKSTKTDYRIPISNQIISKIKFFKKQHSFFEYLFSAFISYLQVISRIILFFVLIFINSTAKYKLKAYIYTLKKLSKYVFLNDNSVFIR
jgi:N-acetylglucosaminyl-diphospho-decaprenol L-rhamnosyltransferase